jgi:hypothetical protein
VWVTTGTTVTALIVKLRAGQSNTTTAQIGNSLELPSLASTLMAIPFHFIDTSGISNANNLGYSVTVSQVGAGSNGTVTAVTYEVDYSTP